MGWWENEWLDGWVNKGVGKNADEMEKMGVGGWRNKWMREWVDGKMKR